MKNTAPLNDFQSAAPFANRPRSFIRWETAGMALLVVSLGFLFTYFSSGGHWNDWPTSSSYYNQLADGFLQGKPYLLTEPPPQLTALPNPYTQAARKGISVIWDASYYHGHYFLYWGPIPSVGIAIVRLFADLFIGDYVVTLIASCGSLLFLALILWRLYRQFFPHLSVWLVYLGTMAVTLGSPFLWILNRPMVYEGAIASAQMFLLAGIYFFLPVFSASQRYQPWRYFLSATCWMLGIACRISILGAIGVFVIAAILLIIRGRFSRSKLWVALLSLMVPIFIGASLLCSYNFVRFGNPIETGLQYQFTDNDYTNPANPMFTFWAMPLNIYNYFGRHVHLLRSFPFVKPIDGKVTYHPLPFLIPTLYYAEPVTAIPLSAPFALSILGLGFSLPSMRKILPTNLPSILETEMDRRFRFFWMCLLAAMLAIFVPLMFYWYAAERFALDFLPLALILAACGAWKLKETTDTIHRYQKLVFFVITGMALWTSAMSILLAVMGYGNHW
jgi:hypothetical protein